MWDGMEPDFDSLLSSAMRLPPEERAALAFSLLESLETPPDEGVDAAWGFEIARRFRELDSGEVKAVPWSEARRAILRE
jgi:putative addiction module component (TIGR02574 family)